MKFVSIFLFVASWEEILHRFCIPHSNGATVPEGNSFVGCIWVTPMKNVINPIRLLLWTKNIFLSYLQVLSVWRLIDSTCDRS